MHSLSDPIYIGASQVEPTCQFKETKKKMLGFDLWFKNILEEGSFISVFLAGESMEGGAWRSYSPQVVRELD